MIATTRSQLGRLSDARPGRGNRRPWRAGMWRRNYLIVIGGGAITAIALLAIFAPYLTPYDPVALNIPARHLPPSRQHLFGTDFFGRDVFTRVAYGARYSLAIGFSVVILQALIGVPLGLLAGGRGGWTDRILMRVTDMFMAFPGILFALSIMAVRGPGVENVIAALSLRGWPIFARLARAEVLTLREQEYAVAAVTLGVTPFRVMWRHLLPNVLPTLIVYASLAVATPILSEASLSFLGLGLSPPTPSWGLIISDARAYLTTAWWGVIFPGCAIAWTVIGFNMLGDGLRNAFDPKLRRSR